MILDLRGDPGGILTQSLEIANMFLQPGQQIAAVKGREGPTQIESAKAAPIAPTIPLVVLTDERTASASEIVAGALQDHDRALVVGQTSFGKGLVQGVYNRSTAVTRSSSRRASGSRRAAARFSVRASS